MSPKQQGRGGKIAAAQNLYTAILALAFSAVVATAVLVTYKCYIQYGTIFKMP